MLFNTGMIVQSEAISNYVNHEYSDNASENFHRIMGYLKRHISGNWGDIHKDDVGLNEEAIEKGYRILSVYKFKDEDGENTIFIITEADRSVTTILFDVEY